MVAKKIIYGEEARQGLRVGVDQLVRAVRTTLGPLGRNVALEKSYGAPHVTKDGVSVAKQIELKNPVENMAVQMVREVASRTADVAGDGTTTATVLAGKLIEGGLRGVTSGLNPMEIKRGMDEAVAEALIFIEKHAHKISKHEEIEQIATISANNDKEIGSKIAEAFKIIGPDGVITVEDAKSMDTTIDTVSGMQFDRGYLSPYFITNAEKMQVEFENAAVLVVEQKISNLQQLLPILEPVAKAGTPLLIIADDIEPEALSTLVVNRLRGGLKICAVKAPGFGDRKKEMLKDISILTGATYVSEEIGLTLSELTPAVFGKVARKIIVTKDTTLLIEGAGKSADVKDRAEAIRREIESTTSSYDKEKLQERLARLVGGAAVIRVGGMTEVEVKEKRDRVEDALAATRAAIQEGIIAGGGLALLRASQDLKSRKSDAENFGFNTVRVALMEPLIQIVNNAGENGQIVAEKVLAEKSFSHGYNAATGAYVDMLKEGVIDPVKVVKTALKNANSIAGAMITMEAVVVDDPAEKEKESKMSMPPMGGGGMGGF